MSKVLVNLSKKERAEAIVGFITGERTPADNGEAARADRFAKVLNEAKIDLKDKNGAILFVYEKLGGLVRTEEEQKQAEARKKEAQKKGKKKMI